MFIIQYLNPILIQINQTEIIMLGSVELLNRDVPNGATKVTLCVANYATVDFDPATLSYLLDTTKLQWCDTFQTTIDFDITQYLNATNRTIDFNTYIILLYNKITCHFLFVINQYDGY